MKSPEQVRVDVAKRIRSSWSQVLGGADWKPGFPLGTSALTGRRLAEAWPDTHRDAVAWQEWMDSRNDLELVVRAVSVHGSSQSLPATLLVPTVDVAAELVGGEWPARLARGRRRHAVLSRRFPALGDPAGMLRLCDRLPDVDFDLACRAAEYFSSPHQAGLTARQVPVEGMGSKWLDAHAGIVRVLAGLDALDLLPGRPQRVHLTYLDPEYLATGGRRHDLVTIGDTEAIAYRPRVVVISENRDTAQLFPQVSGGIAIEGDGRGPGGIAALEWVRAARHLHYWGDMDADGLEILNGFRAAGLPVRSLFMDMASYVRWEQFGVDHDHRGATLRDREPRAVERLEPGELELYLALTSPGWRRHRRIEQERIPLEEAAAVVRAPHVPGD
jgi:hypothetical protein